MPCLRRRLVPTYENYALVRGSESAIRADMSLDSQIEIIRPRLCCYGYWRLMRSRDSRHIFLEKGQCFMTCAAAPKRDDTKRWIIHPTLEKVLPQNYINGKPLRSTLLSSYIIEVCPRIVRRSFLTRANRDYAYPRHGPHIKCHTATIVDAPRNPSQRDPCTCQSACGPNVRKSLAFRRHLLGARQSRVLTK